MDEKVKAEAEEKIMASWAPWRKKLKNCFDHPDDSTGGKVLHYFFLVGILANVAVLCLETLDGPNQKGDHPDYPDLPQAITYDILGGFFSIIFTVEIIARAMTATDTRVFFKHPLIWCDIAAVIPFYVELLRWGFGMIQGQTEKDDPTSMVNSFLGLIKLFRVLRVVTMARHFYGIKVLSLAIAESTKPLLITLFFLIISAMVFATAIFYSEPCYNKATCEFTDIFNAGYFIVVTVTTVGFGDQAPNLDRAISTLTTILAVVLGSLFLSMPLAIIGNKFNSAWRRQEESRGSQALASQKKIMQQNGEADDFRYTEIDARHHMIQNDYYELSDELNVLRSCISSADVSDRLTSFTSAEISVQPSQIGKWLESSYGKFKAALDTAMDLHDHLRNTIEYLSLDPSACTLASNDQEERQDSKKSGRLFSKSKAPADPVELKKKFDEAVVQAEQSTSWRDKLWLICEVPESSSYAQIWHYFVMGLAYTSVFVFYAQTMPEFHEYGPSTRLCEDLVREYCSDLNGTAYLHQDRGCFSANVPEKRMKFFCASDTTDPLCYGVKDNFGFPGSECNNTLFNTSGIEQVCRRRQCDNTHLYMFNANFLWPYLEWFYGIAFPLELTLRFIASREPKKFFYELYNVVDAACTLPFFIELVDYIRTGVEPTYEIVASNPSFLSAMRMLKTIRILKLARHFSGTSVLIQTLKLSWRRLTIPLFFLLIACLLFGGVLYEIERGTQCFIGEQCMWWGKDLLEQKELVAGLPEGKRILIQNDQQTLVPDMLRSTWLALITFTSVGYGRIYPRTPVGKLVSMFGMVFGACYTAMPLSLVGSQFYVCYEEHERANQTIQKKTESKRRSTRRNSILVLSADETNRFGTYSVLKDKMEKMNEELQNMVKELKERCPDKKYTIIEAEMVRKTMCDIQALVDEAICIHMSFAATMLKIQEESYISVGSSM